MNNKTRHANITQMAEHLYQQMVDIADDRPFDSISIYEEWVVDGVDPEDGGCHNFIFLPDLSDVNIVECDS